jgi:tetratricopeptide (TPR) repeat protein
MVAKVTTLHVSAEHTPRGWWVLQGVEYGAVSQVRRLADAATEIREALAYLSGLAEDAFDIEVTYTPPPDYLEAQQKYEQALKQVDDAKAAAHHHNRAAAKTLSNIGMTTRDIGTIMGISHQRAAQLIKD